MPPNLAVREVSDPLRVGYLAGPKGLAQPKGFARHLPSPAVLLRIEDDELGVDDVASRPSVRGGITPSAVKPRICCAAE